MDFKGIPYHYNNVFAYYGVKRRRGWGILAEDNLLSDRRHGHSTAGQQRHGKPPKISHQDLDRADRYLQDLGWEARVLTWDQLAYELDLGVCGETLKDALGSTDYHKCIACTKGWVSQKVARRRKEYAEVMLDRYPTPEDWYKVRFSDEVHWSIAPEGKMRIIRKPGERYCVQLQIRSTLL